VNGLLEKHSEEIQVILAKYPANPEGRRSAVMPLLYMAQHEYGYITKDAIREVAEVCGITHTEVASIIGFYSLYYDALSGKYHVQVCTDLPCALRGAEQFLEKLCENLGRSRSKQ
jgi:NADH-quinone oxidoreductase subunit E